MITFPDALVANLLHGFVAKGGALDEALTQAQLKPMPASLSVHEFVRLCRAVTTLLDDEYGGQNERPQPIGTFSIMAAHVSHATTVDRGFERLAGFHNVLDNTFKVSFHRHSDTAHFIVQRKNPIFPVTELGVELILVLTHRFLAWLAGTWIPITKAWFDYNCPNHYKTYNQSFPHAKLAFQQENSGFSIPRSALDLPLRRSEEEAVGWARRTPLDAFLPVTIEEGLSLQVAKLIESAIERKEELPSMQDLADAMNMADYTLRRRLKREGRDVPAIRHRVRRDFALRLLTEGDDSIEVIAIRLGYSETSAFVRAFKSWTNVTPKSFRQSGRLSARQD